MTKLLLGIGLIVFISACSHNPANKSDFYTWVDESGQIRTVKRKTEEPAEVKKEKAGLAQIDPSEFKSSSDVDRDLKADKMFSWQDQGRQNTYEVDTSSLQKTISQVEAMEAMPTKNPVGYEGGIAQPVLWSRVKNTEIKLSEFYHYNKTLNKDDLLIELPVGFAGKIITIQSYVHDSAIALPIISFLSDRQQYISETIKPYSEYKAETWINYASISGAFKIPAGAAFLLISTNSDYGILEFQGDKVKQVNLGSIMMRIEPK